MSSNVPFGFRLADDGRQLEFDENEQEIQRIASDLRARGVPVIAIVRDLTARGFAKRCGRPWRGGLGPLHLRLHAEPESGLDAGHGRQCEG